VRDLFVDGLRDMPEQERLVVALYYYEELTLKEIGEILGLTESRVSQIHSKALLVLRAKVRTRLSS
jgi:RNA polymerase sigma factor for flagellar operon FliA